MMERQKGTERPGIYERKPVRVGVTIGVVVLVAAYWGLAIAPISTPFRKAREVQITNEVMRRQLLDLQRDVDQKEKQLLLTRRASGKEQVLRGEGYVKEGQRPIRGDGVGSPPK